MKKVLVRGLELHHLHLVFTVLYMNNYFQMETFGCVGGDFPSQFPEVKRRCIRCFAEAMPSSLWLHEFQTKSDDGWTADVLQHSLIVEDRLRGRC